MMELLRKYISILYRYIPVELLYGLLIVFFVGTIVLVYLYGWKRGWKKAVGLLLVEYVGLIYSSTVIFRDVKDVFRYNYEPFGVMKLSKMGKSF